MPASLCLNMIVKDEAHVIEETLRCVTPLIDYWVIVDTGSTDGTQEVIRRVLDRAEIPGELHERPWRDFGTNRTEALHLCRGKADYAWVIDADDLIHGELILPALTRDAYQLKYGKRTRYWRTQIFRDPGAWRYEGVLHEYPVYSGGERSEARIEGRYHVESRRLGGRNLATDKYARDCRILEQALARDPENERTVFYLAQSYFDRGDHARSLEWYRRRVALGGWTEEVFYSHLRIARCLAHLKEPWEQVLSAYLTAYQYRPTRAEPLFEIAQHYRLTDQFHLAYGFAKLAAGIPYPQDDRLFINKEVYDYRAKDELSIAAYYTGHTLETFELCREILDAERVHDGLLDEETRDRIVKNRDFAVEHVKDQHLAYPARLIKELTRRTRRRGGRTRCRITLTITSCKRLQLFCDTMSSFLNTCRDARRIGRWICIDDSSDEADRRHMAQRYPFFEFIWKEPREKGHARSMNALLEGVESPWWVHLEDDWQFFVPRDYIGEALAVLGDRHELGQVLFNRNYGEALACRDLVGGEVRRTQKQGLRYRLHQHIPRDSEAYGAFFAAHPPGTLSNVWWPHYSLRPSMIKTAAIRKVGAFDPGAAHFELDFAKRYTAQGLCTAFFDEITALHRGRCTWERDDPDRPNAYSLNQQAQFE